MYTILGVSHFTFYNHTLGPHATCVLNHYINGQIPLILNNETQSNTNTTVKLNNSVPSRVTVSMLPWQLRMRSQKEIRTEGLFAALNDCLYRNMYRYIYIF